MTILLLKTFIFLFLSLIIQDSHGDVISDKGDDLSELLAKIYNHKTCAVGVKFYPLTPDEQKLLERYARLRGNAEFYDAHMDSYVGKMKKNAEMNRGIVRALDNIDMYNAGKRSNSQINRGIVSALDNIDMYNAGKRNIH